MALFKYLYFYKPESDFKLQAASTPQARQVNTVKYYTLEDNMICIFLSWMLIEMNRWHGSKPYENDIAWGVKFVQKNIWTLAFPWSAALDLDEPQDICMRVRHFWVIAKLMRTLMQTLFHVPVCQSLMDYSSVMFTQALRLESAETTSDATQHNKSSVSRWLKCISHVVCVGINGRAFSVPWGLWVECSVVDLCVFYVYYQASTHWKRKVLLMFWYKILVPHVFLPLH